MCRYTRSECHSVCVKYADMLHWSAHLVRESAQLERQTATVQSRRGFVRRFLLLASSLRVEPASTERARSSPFSLPCGRKGGRVSFYGTRNQPTYATSLRARNVRALKTVTHAQYLLRRRRGLYKTVEDIHREIITKQQL